MERNVDINFLLLHLKYAFKEERKGLNKQANKQIWQPHRHIATPPQRNVQWTLKLRKNDSKKKILDSHTLKRQSKGNITESLFEHTKISMRKKQYCVGDALNSYTLHTLCCLHSMTLSSCAVHSKIKSKITTHQQRHKNVTSILLLRVVAGERARERALVKHSSACNHF